MISINGQNVNGPGDVVAVLVGAPVPFPPVALKVTDGDAGKVEIRAMGVVTFSAPGWYTLGAAHGFETASIRVVACDPRCLERFQVSTDNIAQSSSVEQQRLFVLRSAARFSGHFDGTLESCGINWLHFGASRAPTSGAVPTGAQAPR